MGTNNGVIPLSNVVEVNVSLTPAGVPNYNVNNIGLFTTDAFLSNTQGDLFRIYVDPVTVADDFGSATETASQAEAIFSQQLNILAGEGVLVIIPYQQGAITAAVEVAAGTGYAVGDIIYPTQTGGVGGALEVTTIGGNGAVTGVSIQNPGFGYAAAVGLPSTSSAAGTGCTITITTVARETLEQAILRANSYIYFNGIISTDYGSNTTWLTLAQFVQSLSNQILFLPSFNPLNLTGVFLQIQQALLTNTRCLFYTISSVDARFMGAAYASWALSTNYEGDNTTITMNLKQLVGVDPDPGLNETLLALCVTAGVDVYANYGGSFPGVVSNGNNQYLDEVTNRVWLALALQVAGFDALATVQTKIPITEQGISVLKAAYRLVMQQAVSNGYIAPGNWTSATTFGNLQQFLSNIQQFGFYMYSQPVAQQLAANRSQRQAPVIRIAALQADAVQQSTVIVNINR